MTDYIKREDVLRILENGEYWPIGKLEDDILHLEAEDVVEVVRCKDCIYFEIDEENADIDDWYHTCGDTGFGVGKMDFCSHGERKEAK